MIELSRIRTTLFVTGPLALALLGASCSKQMANSGAVASFQEFSAAEAVTNAGKPVPVDPTCANDDCQHRRQEFRYVVYVGKQVYCYWDLKTAQTGTDYLALATSLEKSITTTTSYSQYYVLLRKWASAFHDGHVNVMAKADMTGLEIYTGPVRVEVLAPATDHEKVVIASASKDVPQLAVGDEVEVIDGQPVADALTQAASDASSGSTDRMRRFFAARRLVDVIGIDAGSTALEIKVRPADGSAEKTVSLARAIEIDAKPKDGAEGPESTGAELISARILPGKIGYLRIDGFEGTQDDFLLSQAMDRLANTSSLIIDLRRNGGGDLSGDRIIERLATSKVIRYKQSERISDFTLSRRIENFLLTPDVTGLFALWHDLTVDSLTDHHYGKPVVALIGPNCFSACDTFSAALKANGLATFIGEGTGGGTGTPLVFDLPYSPLSFRYAVIRGQTAKGDTIEGNGTLPDIYIEPTVTDRVKGQDSQLAKAVSVVQTLVQPAVIPVTFDLSSVPSLSAQTLDVSPSKLENNELLRFSSNDEL